MIRTFAYLSESDDFDQFYEVDYEISTITQSYNEPNEGGLITHFEIKDEDGENVTNEFGLKELNKIERLCYANFAEHDNRDYNLEDYYQEQFERRREDDGMF